MKSVPFRRVLFAVSIACFLSGAALAQQGADSAYLPQGSFDQSTTQLIELAAKGNAGAQFKLAKELEEGFSALPSDPSKAIYWYRQAAQKNHPQAQAALAVLHIQGRYAAKDFVVAQMVMLLARKNDVGDALIDGVELASEVLAKSLSAEQKQQAEALAAAWKPGDLIPYIAPGSAPDKQLAAWREQASAGDGKAQFALAEAFESGKLVPHDQAAADELFRKAASNGSAEAKDRLSPHYKAFEQGFKAFEANDDATALKLWKPCAEAGDARCQFGLGRFLKVHNRPDQAALWYRLSAEQGFSRAQNDLGMLYMEGEGVSEDAGEAERWFRKAADQGHISGQFNLGLLYTRLPQTPEVKKWSRYWMQKAADQGHGTAQMYLKLGEDKVK